MAKNILAWNKVGSQFYREIGKKQNGKPQRFYLGADEKKATACVTRLEALWDGIEARWNELAGADLAGTEFPCWDDLTISFGHAISKGDWSITVEPPKLDTDSTAVWLASLRTFFPMIQIQITDPSRVEEGNQAFIEAGQRRAEKEEEIHRQEMRTIKKDVAPFGGKVTTKETLHDALDAYKEWIEKTFVDIEGRTTQTGKKQGERAARIKRYAKDMPLSDLGTHEIEAIIEFWRTRPKKPAKKTKAREPYSFTLCKHTIRLFKHFVRWLHKEKTFPWKKPVDLDLDRIKIVPDAETKYKVETYSKEELGILWQHASYFERQLLLLALNCGFSISEIGSLDWHEVEGEYVRGLRPKTKVYGEFKLWEMTRQAMGTPKKKGLVFVTESGLSLIARTTGNNVCAKIPAAWYRLLNRVEKHHPNFKRLGFHHLRKTAGNEIRKLSDGETMGVFLRHGKPVKTDALAGVYSNADFEKVFKAQDKLWESWKEIFTPLDDVQLPRKTSPEQIRQIRRLKKQGIKTKKLAETFGVSPDTIRAYCRKKRAR
jgi:integrase/DNA-binding transcriptional regulator YiaG